MATRLRALKSRYESVVNGFRMSHASYQKANIGAHQLAPIMTHMAAFARATIALWVN
jgi:hypothetical protein